MSIELECGVCEGQLIADVPGSVVECPICGAHLEVPASSEIATVVAAAEVHPEGPPADAPVSPPAIPAVSAEADSMAAEAVHVQATAGNPFAFLSGLATDIPVPALPEAITTADEPIADNVPSNVLDGEQIAPEPTVPSDSLAVVEASAPSLLDSPEPVVSLPAVEPTGALTNGAAAEPVTMAFIESAPKAITVDCSLSAAPADPTEEPQPTGDIDPTEPSWFDNVASAEAHSTESHFAANPTVLDPAPPLDSVAPSEAAIAAAEAGSTLVANTNTQPVPQIALGSDVVPRRWFQFAISYASAVTLAMLYLLWIVARQKYHALESLPDIKPPAPTAGGNVGWKRALPQWDLPPGHRLKLGESQRFGNLVVTPLKVTQGPLEFRHFLRKEATLPATTPVLKLWLRFENVSSNQTFVPLDRELMLNRKYLEFGKVIANNFLCNLADRKSDDKLVFVYDLPVASEFSIEGQTIDAELAPGDQLETFIPSEEDALARLEGDLVWRVQIRKGHNARSGNGVTTLIDVEFPKSAIESRS